MKNLTASIAIFFFFLFSLPVWSQQVKTDSLVGKFVTVEMKDGNSLNGKVIGESPDSLAIQSSLFPRLAIAKKDIHEIDVFEKENIQDDGYLRFNNPNSTRYLFNTNGFGLKKGEGYVYTAWATMVTASFGLSDHFTVGVGTSPWTLFSGYPILVVSPKANFKIAEKLHVGAGAFMMLAGGWNFDGEGFSAGILHGNLTYGTRENNFNVGIGYGYAEGEFSRYPAISLGGMWRTGRKWAFLTENYLISAGGENVFLAGLGMRYMTKKSAWDFGLVTNHELLSVGALGIPWVSYSIAFKTKSKKSR